MEEIEKREPVKRKHLTKKQEEYLKTALFLEMFADVLFHPNDFVEEMKAHSVMVENLFRAATGKPYKYPDDYQI